MSSKLFRSLGRFVAVAALASGFMAGNAFADATYDAGALGSTAWNSLSVLGAGFVGTGSFTDTYTFSIDDLLMVSSAVKLDLGFSGSPDIYHIDNLTMALFDSSNSLLESQTGSPVSIQTPLAAGNYYVTISGIANGSQGGLYQFAIAAVPEPGTWAMLLAGLGMLGFIARRRLAPSDRSSDLIAA